jgi:hypothetical protein
MKKILFLLTMGALIASLASAQKEPVARQVNVTASMVARRPANAEYVLDLKGETIYHLAAGVDYGHILLRSAETTVNLGELITKSGETPSGDAYMGTVGGVVKAAFDAKRLKKRTNAASTNTRPGGGPSFSCGDYVCVCHGDDDCNHLFTTNSCGALAVCFSRGGQVTCFCSAAPH